MDTLTAISPELATLVRWLLTVGALLLLWLALSIPTAITYAALKSALHHLGKYFAVIAARLFAYAGTAWRRVKELRDSAVANLTVRYVFGASEARWRKELDIIDQTLRGLNEYLGNASNNLDTRLSALSGDVRQAIEVTQPSSKGLKIPELGQVQADTRKARTAVVALVVCIPIVVALISVNTALLTKFFESFVDEYVSYRLGIKWATVLGLLFSFIELALGIGLYYVSRPEERGQLFDAVKKLSIGFLIVSLALVETYLYLLLSADIGSQIAASGIKIPKGLEGMHSWWLAPLGFVVVTALAIMGHIFIDALNNLSNASATKDLRAALDDLKRRVSQMDSVWDSIRGRAATAQTALKEFEEDLSASKRSNPSAMQMVEEAIQKLKRATEASAAARREPVSNVSTSEAASQFDLHIFLALMFLITLGAFCWLQIHLLGNLEQFKAVHWWVYLVLALVEAGAVIISGYKAYPPLTIVVQGRGRYR